MNYDLLENITGVEISTAIVAEIADEMFIPWEVYQALFFISDVGLEQSQIDLSLRSRYLQLRRQLELAYCLLLIDPNSSVYNRRLVKEIQRDLPVLSRQDSQWQTLATRLPEPIPSSRDRSMSAVNRLLGDRSFSNILQQLYKKKVALDRRQRILQSSDVPNDITDSTYAQTSLQLDGKIINRYSEAILARSDRDLLLQLHEQSTAAGEQQWRAAIGFVLSLVK